MFRTSCSCSSHTGGLPYSRGDRRASRRHWDRRSRPRPRYTVSRECSIVWSRSYDRCIAGLQEWVCKEHGPVRFELPAGGSLGTLGGLLEPALEGLREPPLEGLLEPLLEGL